MDEISIEKARGKLGDIVRDAQRHGITTRITLNGKAAAVVAPDSTRLTGHDRQAIADARELAGLPADAAVLRPVHRPG